LDRIKPWRRKSQSPETPLSHTFLQVTQPSYNQNTKQGESNEFENEFNTNKFIWLHYAKCIDSRCDRLRGQIATTSAAIVLAVMHLVVGALMIGYLAQR
jgi:hypothetical protein